MLHMRFELSLTLFTGIGFIVANVPGLVLGAFAGNRLGAIRDAKGKSVAAVFSELGATQKAEVCLSMNPALCQTEQNICPDSPSTGHQGVGFCPRMIFFRSCFSRSV